MSALSPNMIGHAGQTDRGRVRERNEDNWYANAQQGLYLVADGMGGLPYGQLASQIVVESLPALLRERLKGVDRLDNPKAMEQVLAALDELSDQLLNKGKDRPKFAGMGSTVVLAVVRDRQALVAHMGDSRAYLLRRQHLEQLTTDHTFTQELIDCGLIAPDKAATHFGRNLLTRYVGMHDLPLPVAQTLDLLADDRLLLCTDGLTKMVSDEQLHSILSEEPVPEAACRRLISTANEAGGIDNVTALIVSLSSSSQPEQSPGGQGIISDESSEQTRKSDEYCKSI